MLHSYFCSHFVVSEACYDRWGVSSWYPYSYAPVELVSIDVVSPLLVSVLSYHYWTWHQIDGWFFWGICQAPPLRNVGLSFGKPLLAPSSGCWHSPRHSPTLMPPPRWCFLADIGLRFTLLYLISYLFSVFSIDWALNELLFGASRLFNYYAPVTEVSAGYPRLIIVE